MLQVTMLLANALGQPSGSVDDRIVLSLELTRHGEIDQAAYDADPNPWAATRSTPDGQIHQGDLVRTDKGWALRGEHGEDSPLWVLGARLFRPGEYVTLRTRPDTELTYRVVDVQQGEVA